jgi:hypothetical protein
VQLERSGDLTQLKRSGETIVKGGMMYYWRAGVKNRVRKSEVWWSEHTRRSRSAAEHEAEREARRRGGRPLVRWWDRQLGLWPADGEPVQMDEILLVTGYDTSEGMSPSCLCYECAHWLYGRRLNLSPLFAGDEWGQHSGCCERCDAPLDLTLVPDW